MKGALVGAAGGALGAVTRSFTGGAVSVGLSYDSANGFGASVGVGLNGVASATVGMSEYGGPTASVGLTVGGSRVGVNYSREEGFGVSAALVLGDARIGVSHTQRSGTSLAMGIQTQNGLTAGATYSRDNGFGATMGATNGNYSGGISYNRNEGFGAFASRNTYNRNGSMASSDSLTFNQRDGVGVERTTNNSDGSSRTLGVTQNGGLSAEYTTANGNSVSVGYNFNSGSFSASASIENRDSTGRSLGRTNVGYDSESGFSSSVSPVNDPSRININQGIATSQAELRGSLESQAVGVRAKYQELDEAKKKWLAANGGSTEGWEDLSEEAKETRIQNKSGELMGTGARDQHTTRNNIIKRAWGNVKDFGNQLVGNYQDHSGFLEKDEKGRPAGFKDRTCFVAGTKVHTQTGLKNIEDIQFGDLVASWNEESKEYSYKKVTELFVHEVDLLYTIKIGNASLETTWNHPFWVVGKKAWVEARDLYIGDLVLNKDGNTDFIHSITHKKVEPTKVYNFEVADNHTYFVGEDGVLVHNYVVKNQPSNFVQRACSALGGSDGLCGFAQDLATEMGNDVTSLANPIGMATGPGKAAAKAIIKNADELKEIVKYSDKLVEDARKLYPKKAGKIEKHHPVPQYLGGPKKQELVPIDGAYHQVITNEFNTLHPHGSPKPTPERLQQIMNEVYRKYPLPPP